ncbi:MAG: RES domain-containing protein [Sphingobacteriaceae bacterium]|nr:RES domain-containing protein [Sphingobacteriaceae bacterium]
MKLIELFQNEIIRLPFHQQADPKKSFREFLFEKLDAYKSKIDSLDFSELPSIFSPDVEKLLVTNLIEGIKKSVDLYLDGYPFDAYSELKKSFDMSMFSHLTHGTLPEDRSLYRLRKEKGAYSLTQKELFHIPFNNRIKVSTQRYSIPGFPSLYAANSVYVAWEELGRPTPDQVQACRLQTKKPITFFDLTTDVYLGETTVLNSLKPEDLWKHLIVWPLIASCSVKVLDREAAFKPEYIIPQLILQIVRKEKKWDGIRFSSTHIDLNKMKSAKGAFYNYVLPVKENKNDGYCDKLNELFEMTEIVPWQIVDTFTKPQGTFLHPKDTTPYEIQAIELISEKPLAYQYSIFGTLEKRLIFMTPTKIITS